ncbi:DUF2254 domain-containing protein [Tropicibacter oceani]|uniref:DUF2254 domain-containing protein n=1 Tax=Tropicibacter oceani TaxID=3058420 RepID=A0ABY8QJP6_9RHOB|nr:DUF2254 domain-containing protein [Tropicibacter oceani]WGW04779.1 DUF2254 domain-containing protein [Tropicibacter oceani]
MISKGLMQVLRLSRSLGTRAVLMTMLALASVFVAPLFDPLIPDPLKDRFGRDAVLPVLTILASSMLAVTTFSLGVMVQAFQSASSQATPRAYRILMQDGTTQTVLATFVGAFLFSLTAIVMFRANFYDAAAAVVIFAMTIFVIAAIILAILRWIGHLSQLGSMDHILSLIESVAQPPLKALATYPALGAVPASRAEPPPPGVKTVTAPCAGYVQFIDMPGLNSTLTKAGARLWITAAPGAFVVEGDDIALLNIQDDVIAKAVAKHFTIGKTRSMEQDARFGLIVMAEIANRALSPGVNDPGTAIDVIHRQLNLLHGCLTPTTDAPRFDRIVAPEVSAEDLLEDAFDILTRDGAGRVEIMNHLQEALGRLSNSAWPEMAKAAKEHLPYVQDQARAHITMKTDLETLGLGG